MHRQHYHRRGLTLTELLVVVSLVVLLAAILLPAAFWLGENAIERSLLIIPVLLVLIVELINSAIEAAIDRIGTDRHPLSGQAKDIGSAAVMISLMLCVTCWGLQIVERLR